MSASTRLIACLLAAAATGVAMMLLFPPFDASWLVWVVLMPVMGAVWSLSPAKRGRKAFLVGWLAGAAGFLLSFSWLRTVTTPGWAALSVYLGLFPALWAAFTATVCHPGRGAPASPAASIRRAFWIAGVWAGLEWLRGWLFTGFGWDGLAVAFHSTPVFAQSADLLGISGLSFLPVFVQAVVAQYILRIARPLAGIPRRPAWDVATAACLIAATVGYGRWRIATVPQAESIPLRTLLVQLNIPQEAARRLVDPVTIHLGYEDETIDALKDLPADLRPDWVIWPESSLQGALLRAPETWAMADTNWNTMRRIREEAGPLTTIMGLVELEAELHGEQISTPENHRSWNSMTVFGPEGELQTFRKRHLVIFGEYIPFVEQIPWLAKLYEAQTGGSFRGGFSRGESLEPLQLQVRGQEIGMIPTVCFEDSVGRLVRRFCRNSPQVMVNITNDGWFKESIGAEQHFANARFRAIELRRPLVRCANTGVTAVVDTLGLTRHPQDPSHRQELRDEKGSTFLRGHLFGDAAIPVRPSWTLYAAIGDAGVILLSLGAFSWGLVSWFRHRTSA